MLKNRQTPTGLAGDGFAAGHRYPFMPEVSCPATKYFWPKMYRISMGIMDTVAAVKAEL